MFARCTRSWFSILLLAWSGAYAETPGSSSAASFSPHIKTLAASCAACHGTHGNSVAGTPVLAGLDSNYFMLQMQAFRSGERQATVMHRHAKGLNIDEIEQLAIYFSRQQREPALSPPSQVLDEHRGN